MASSIDLVSVQDYFDRIPEENRWKLNKEIDFEHCDVPTHLDEIANSMYEWEGRVATKLGLTRAEVAAIKVEHPKKLVLQTRSALQQWKQKNGFRATYRKLILLFHEAEKAGYAMAVCKVLTHEARDHDETEKDSLAVIDGVPGSDFGSEPQKATVETQDSLTHSTTDATKQKPDNPNPTIDCELPQNSYNSGSSTLNSRENSPNEVEIDSPEVNVRRRKTQKSLNLDSHSPSNTINRDPTPDSPSDLHLSNADTINSDNIMHVTEPTLFSSMAPYQHFHQPHVWIEYVIVVFIVYQIFASILITLCEEKCLQRVFVNNLGVNVMELVRRICLLSIRIAVRVIIPFVFYRQLCNLAEGERRYLKSRENVKMSKSTEKKAPSHCTEVTLWSIVPHAVLFSVILLYTGGFLIAEDSLTRRSICVLLPYFGMQVVQFFDCLAVFFMLMIVGILKDCYCLENNSPAAVKHYDIMRQRWFLMDWFCYITPFFLLVFTMSMFTFGNPLVPTPSATDELWCAWITGLTLLQFSGSSPNRFLKISCIVGHILSSLVLIVYFTFEQEVKKVHIPPGSGVILLYTTLVVTLFNFLVCLACCHWRVKGWRSKRFFLTSFCLFILVFSSLATVVREVFYTLL